MFRRYPDITNVKPRFLADIRNSAPSVDEEFQVTEKVHGASLQVYTDGVVTHAASRNQDLGPIATASLFGAHELIASLNEPLQVRTYAPIASLTVDVSSVSLCSVHGSWCGSSAPASRCCTCTASSLAACTSAPASKARRALRCRTASSSTRRATASTSST
jgi:hypothetical protein